MGVGSGREVKVLVDRLMHQGMDEAHGVTGCEQVHRDQRVDGHASGVELHVGECGDTVQARLAAQDGDRSGHGNRLRRQPPKAQHRGLGHGPRPGPLDQTGRLPGRLDPIGLEGAEELLEQERNTARRRPARFDERHLGAAQPRTHELPDAVHAQRRGTDHPHAWPRHQLGQQRGVRLWITGPNGNQQHDRHPLEPSGEVGEEPQGWRIGPLHVVDGNHHGITPGEVRGQPVEAVSHGGWLAGWRAGPNFLGRYDRFRQGCRPLQQMLSLRSRRTGDDRGEQLAHDAEREVALEERAVARDRCHARLDGASPSRVEE